MAVAAEEVEVRVLEVRVLAEEAEPEAQVAAGGGERRKYVNRVDYLCIHNFYLYTTNS